MKAKALKVAYIPGPIKTRRSRRSKAEMNDIMLRLVSVLGDGQPMTVRGVFYAMVATGLIRKTEQEYDGTVGRLLVKLRRAGVIPYEWITDSTRWQIKPETRDSAEGALEATVRAYRQALWSDQSVYLEVWCEKDAIAGVLSDVTGEWDVPLMVVRGDSSDTFLYGAAKAMASVRRPVQIYYFGDHDKTGIRIPQTIERKLRNFAPSVPLTFTRAAVTPQQIEAWNLPTRPSKDLDFAHPCVEVDAIPAARLRALVEDCIARHVDNGVLERTRRIEAEERSSLRDFLEQWDAA